MKTCAFLCSSSTKSSKLRSRSESRRLVVLLLLLFIGQKKENLEMEENCMNRRGNVCRNLKDDKEEFESFTKEMSFLFEEALILNV
uniref:Uncharacterized protein n=1 Tax=Cucumis melo TaxID=3656 RepID=A0A9I9EA23_CUCME